MRLIDADKYRYSGDLENEPTVEAVPVENLKDYVPVVRCKDCKHRDMTSKFECDFSAVFVFDDHFCSYGESKEEK